ncbi:MAG: SusE domain-containing protein [Dysgonamonadaceae bacterium]|jgi:hypothetical protein|nr:SusE domain-containing protein [Dysgonamonadaceae bacterium]
MKNSLKLILSIFAMGLFFNACEDTETTVLSAGASPILGQTPAAIVIDKNNVNSEKFTIGFTSGTYSTPVATTTQFEIGRQGTNFTPIVELGAALVGNNQSAEFTYRELNAALTKLGLTPKVETKIELRIKTHASVYGQLNTGVMPLYSEIKTISVTPFEPEPSWVYAVGAFQGWDRTGGYSLVSMTDNGVYIGYINFPEAESAFLIMPDNSSSWDHKWGSDDGANLIKDGGSDIKSPGAGYHKVTADLTNLTIEMVPYSWGIIGDATPTGWDSDTDMIWNYETLKWELTINLTAGSFKIRLNNDWTINYGITGGVVTSGGDNIPITESGTYLVTLDEENLVITWTKK